MRPLLDACFLGRKTLRRRDRRRPEAIHARQRRALLFTSAPGKRHVRHPRGVACRFLQRRDEWHRLGIGYDQQRHQQLGHQRTGDSLRLRCDKPEQALQQPDERRGSCGQRREIHRADGRQRQGLRGHPNRTERVRPSAVRLRGTFILGLALACASAAAQDAGGKPFAAGQIGKGAALYETHCQTCHGPRLANPEWAKDLRKFPREDHARFVDTVTYGVRNMPPWADVLEPDDIEALWAYVVAGEGKK
ncbi:MAG: cytochrome c [Betaproteobacteria bacterium]|nr:MAG: cytochrome c [Betaproteobacteria bacterium]